MGKGFGELGVRVRHIITYSISPYEQRVFTGMLTRAPGNLLRRVFDQIPFMAPAFITLAVVLHFGKKEHDRLLKKNPEDYANDVWQCSDIISSEP